MEWRKNAFSAWRAGRDLTHNRPTHPNRNKIEVGIMGHRHDRNWGKKGSTILRKFALPIMCVFCLVACNAAKTIPIEALGDIPAGATLRFFFSTSGSNAEAYLTRPAGPGPFPLMILFHGHTFESIGGAGSVVPEAEAFASDLCYAGLAVSLPGYGASEVPA